MYYEACGLMIQTLLKQSCLFGNHLLYHAIIHFVLISHLNRRKEPYTKDYGKFFMCNKRKTSVTN